MSAATDSARPVCSTATFGDSPVTLKYYKCATCRKMRTNEIVCEGCARFCHAGHDLACLGYGYGVCSCGNGSAGCHCYLRNPVPGDEAPVLAEGRQCRTTMTGTVYVTGDYVFCRTCRMEDLCACVPCMTICHAGHEESGRDNGPFYCDCPMIDRYHCRIKPYSGQVRTVYCTRFFGENFPEHPVVRCKTCRVDVCPSCWQKCHSGHDMGDEGTGRCCCPETVCVDVKNREPAA